MSSANKRNLPLDFLRGVAILLVFGRHLELPRPDGIVGICADVWFRIGWLGVDLFFVLSGFLIGGLLLVELQSYGRIDIKRFLVRRGLKIYPPYLLFLAYLMLMPAVRTMIHGGDSWATFVEQWSVYWPNLIFLQNYLGHSAAGHLWTLAVEEHFYLILPFLIAGLVAMRRTQWLVPIAICVVPLCLVLRCLSVWTQDQFSTTLSATHLRLDALLFGVALRGVAQYSPELFRAARRWRFWLVSAGILCWLPNVFVAPTNNFIRTIGLTGTFLGSAAFLIAAYNTRRTDFGRLAPMVSSVATAVGWIGVYSYAIYLWHVTVMGMLEREFGGWAARWFPANQSLAWLISVLVICAGAVLMGVVANKLVEWPVIRFRDRFFPSRSRALPSNDFTRESTSPAAERTIASGCGAIAVVNPIDVSPSGESQA